MGWFQVCAETFMLQPHETTAIKARTSMPHTRLTGRSLNDVLGLENLVQSHGLDVASCVDLLGKLLEITVDEADSSPRSS